MWRRSHIHPPYLSQNRPHLYTIFVCFIAVFRSMNYPIETCNKFARHKLLTMSWRYTNKHSKDLFVNKCLFFSLLNCSLFSRSMSKLNELSQCNNTIDFLRRQSEYNRDATMSSSASNCLEDVSNTSILHLSTLLIRIYFYEISIYCWCWSNNECVIVKCCCIGLNADDIWYWRQISG